jgi:hypothetical protein
MPYLGAALSVGLVGAATVAVFVLILDTLAGHPLGTPNALGAALFRGESLALDAPIRAGLVFGYTLLHGATFIAVAAAAVSAEHTLSRRGVSLVVQFVWGIGGLFLGLLALFLLLGSLLGIDWRAGMGLERLVLTNAVAAFSMAITVYLRGSGRRASSAGDVGAEAGR